VSFDNKAYKARIFAVGKKDEDAQNSLDKGQQEIMIVE
jgi:hypothetical protein